MKFLVMALCVALAAAGPYKKPPIASIEDLKADSSPRVIGGSVAAPGQFPHQVFNVFNVPEGLAVCGASLICDSWVLTAAHCAQDASQFTLYFGSVNQSQTIEQGRVVLQTREKYVHPGYNPENLNNDIALLRLEQRLKYTKRIQPIPLAIHRTDDSQKVTVSGWGRTSPNSDISAVLMYVELDTITNEVCEDVYGPIAIKDETLCCTGRPEHSTCNGDSGSPLVMARRFTF